MADEAITVTGGNQAVVGEKPPTAEVKPVEARPAEKPPAQAKPAKVETVTAQVKRSKLEDDDEIPDEAEILELSPRVLKGRLTRAKNSELDDIFGHHDREKIVADVKELIVLREGKEKLRKEKLDEVTRLKEEKDAAEAKALVAEARAEAIQAEREVEQVVAMLQSEMTGAVDPEFVEFVEEKHKKDLAKLAQENPAEIERLDASTVALKKHFRKWLSVYLKDHPKYAADGVSRKGLTNGADPDDASPDRERPAPGLVNGKTARPGQANSMTNKEFHEYMRSKGLVP